MPKADLFSKFIDNLGIVNSAIISLRYGEITSALNKRFRDTESKTDNCLQVGSFGRNTGISGISDLDMLYIMPKREWENYRNGKQLRLLQDVKAAISARYPTTKVRVDRLVVTVTYTNFHVEVQPVFDEDHDLSFVYPDTANGGNWKNTNPRAEMVAISQRDKLKNNNLKRLCKMARAWKNKHGVGMGGLLIDTLAYNFLGDTNAYDDTSFLYYDHLCRDYFHYLADLPEQDFYAAPGSGQRVRVKKKFQRQAKKAYNLCLDAIASAGRNNENDKWKKIFGRPFPSAATVADESFSTNKQAGWNDTEQYIEDYYPIDIRYTLEIECEVSQKGYRAHRLKEMIARSSPLLANKQLRFWIKEIDVPEPYQISWKVLNRGEEAQKRDCIRGQIVPDEGRLAKSEPTKFRGDHIVECYAVKDGVVVAKDRIHVPITNNG